MKKGGKRITKPESKTSENNQNRRKENNDECDINDANLTKKGEGVGNENATKFPDRKMFVPVRCCLGDDMVLRGNDRKCKAYGRASCTTTDEIDDCQFWYD